MYIRRGTVEVGSNIADGNIDIGVSSISIKSMRSENDCMVFQIDGSDTIDLSNTYGSTNQMKIYAGVLNTNTAVKIIPTGHSDAVRYIIIGSSGIKTGVTNVNTDIVQTIVGVGEKGTPFLFIGTSTYDY